MQDRLVGIGRSGIGRIVEVGVDPGVDPRADRSERVAVLEARRGAPARGAAMVAERPMKSALVAAGSPGPPRKLLTLTPPESAGMTSRPAGGECRRARDVEIAPVDLGRDSPLEADQRRVVESRSWYTGPDCGCVWVKT